MDTTALIIGSSSVVAIASLAYGVWQGGKAKTANMAIQSERQGVEVMQAAKDRIATKLAETEKRLGAAHDRLALVEQRALELTQSLQATEANLTAEKRSHATTKGNYTRLKDKYSAQVKAAA